MWTFPEQYDVLVIGGGHAGCEAAHAAARMGMSTLLLTISLDHIAKMSCNPAIGGIGKGHMVREIDALGGLMACIIDQTSIQARMLNASKGPAVWAPRAQADKVAYQFAMKHALENTPRLQIKQGSVLDFLVEDGKVVGVTTLEGVQYRSKTIILASGTFLRGLLHLGETKYEGGRAGDKASGLSSGLERLGVQLGRLKTGTPCRVHRRSIDFSQMEEQPGEPGIRFSFEAPSQTLPQVSCHIAYTNAETHEIIRRNIHRSPLYSGQIQGIGPRYCPSIEDKVQRFSDKERHQLFLEPEGLQTEEIYVNGISTSLPPDVQYAMMRSIPGMENVEIMRPAYAIEYDYAVSGQIDYSLECKAVPGLFFAGQINGTTGYEEAAAQGLIAGINAACKLRGEEPFVLKRSESYIAVMIDDLVAKGVTEPYRMFTSRAEYRLLLRQDNADLRLREYGYRLGLIDEERYQTFLQKKEAIFSNVQFLKNTHKDFEGRRYSLAKLLSRPEMTYQELAERYLLSDLDAELRMQVELEIKLEGYIARQLQDIKKASDLESQKLPPNLSYRELVGLRREAADKLDQIRPGNLGQASRIPGVSPADISVLMVCLRKKAAHK